MAQRPPKREKTSRSSSTFFCLSRAVPERMASATQDSMWRPRISRCTCSTAPCTAVSWRRMSTQYLSSSTMRCMPCTCPSIRRRRPRALALLSSSIIVSPCRCWRQPLSRPSARKSGRAPGHGAPHQPPARQGRHQVLESMSAHHAAYSEDPAVENFEELGRSVDEEDDHDVSPAAVAGREQPEHQRNGQTREELDQHIRSEITRPR